MTAIFENSAMLWIAADGRVIAVGTPKRRLAVGPAFALSARLLRLCGEQNHRCCYCGAEFVFITGHRLRPTIEHVWPLSMGGRRHWSNEVAACHYCNSGRGNVHSERYFKWVRADGPEKARLRARVYHSRRAKSALPPRDSFA